MSSTSSERPVSGYLEPLRKRVRLTLLPPKRPQRLFLRPPRAPHLFTPHQNQLESDSQSNRDNYIEPRTPYDCK